MAWLFTNIMCRCIITEVVVPVVITLIWEQRAVVLTENQTVFIMPIIRLAISPVKPVNSYVPVLPEPLAIVVVGVVTASGFCSQPELVPISRLSDVQQLRFQPVVDSRMVQFSNPSLMESAENIGIIPGDRFSTTQHEASATTSVLLQHPAIRTVVSILGPGTSHKDKSSKQEPHLK